MEETLGNLSAFYAMFPGNHKFNVFPLWLAEDHGARLASVVAPHLGHPHSEDLDSEYLNILETRTRTPFFHDVYVDGLRFMLVIGPTETGKSGHANQFIALEQKYGGFTYIFDIGGSYESVVELYGGRVDRVGKDGPRVNPFALEPTESNIKFLYSFIKLLLTNGGAELEPEDDDVIHKVVQDTSRAAHQLRDAGISADTLQGFLARAKQPTPERHLYMVDESSLASTQQIRDFFRKLASIDSVLFIGDVRQHQGVEAGKPFEQLVQ